MRLPLTFQSTEDVIRPLRVKYNEDDVLHRGSTDVRTFVEDGLHDTVHNRPFILRFVGVIEGRANDYLEPDSGPTQRLTLVAPEGEHQQSFIKTACFLDEIIQDPRNHLFDARSQSKWSVVPVAREDAKIYVHFTRSARMGEVERHRAFEGVEAYTGEDQYVHFSVGDWVWIAARLVREDFAFPSVNTRKISWLVKAFHLCRINDPHEIQSDSGALDEASCGEILSANAI
uniref:Fungal-type protein kinase domain-containing protein n=1 Tax=Mycena chlorophos TaxID=658473 RepID=A0ABQ0L133_MYCCL|nr:predicted protein [Mycena chlorophos]